MAAGGAKRDEMLTILHIQYLTAAVSAVAGGREQPRSKILDQ